MEHVNLLSAVENKIENIWITTLHDAARLGDIPTGQQNINRWERINREARPLVLVHYLLKIFKDNDWRIHYIANEYHLYNGKYWKIIEDESIITVFIRHAIRLTGMPEVTYLQLKFIEDTLKQFKIITQKFPKLNKEKVMINMEKETISIDENAEIKYNLHHRKNWQYNILKFDLDVDAKCPMFHKFLDEVLPNQSFQNTLQEYIGYCILPYNYANYEKMLILQGEGANGKSVIYNVLRGVLGKENFSTISLDQLTGDKDYYRMEIEHKFINYSSESGDIDKLSVLKQIASGEPFQAKKLYQHPKMVENYAKLMFNTNSLPNFAEKNEAMKRRLIIIPFDITIPKDRQDAKLAKKIIQNEKAGVFNWIFNGLKKIINGEGFTSNSTLEEYTNLKIMENDTLFHYLGEAMCKKNVGNYNVPSQEFYDNYRAYCYKNGLHPKNQRNFKTALVNNGYHYKRTNTGIKWDLTYFNGITWI